MEIKENEVYNCDCLDLMREMVNQGIVADWLIVDPPYGIKYMDMTKGGDSLAKRRDYDYKDWDNKRLTKEYFDLMFKCSKNQIIFGGNYYTDILEPTKSWIIWNKRKPNIHNDFADCELAWCSKGQARIFNYEYMGMIQGDMKNKDDRFHPTQKPTQIIIELLKYYTNENDLIFDPFMGSFTTAIACHKMGRRYLGAEIDKDYFNKGLERLKNFKAQLSFFDIN